MEGLIRQEKLYYRLLPTITALLPHYYRLLLPITAHYRTITALLPPITTYYRLSLIHI